MIYGVFAEIFRSQEALIQEASVLLSFINADQSIFLKSINNFFYEEIRTSHFTI